MKPKGKNRAGAAVEWCSDEEGHLLLPGLDMDTALRCLAFLPSYLYPLLASLNKTYRSLIISSRCAPLMELRRTLGIVDHLLISKHEESPEEDETVCVNGEEQIRVKIKQSLRVLDLKRKTWLNLAVPRNAVWHNYDTFFCSGTRLFCSSFSLMDVSIHYDFISNKWEMGCPMQEPTRRSCAFAANGDCCFVAGGHKTNGYDLSFGSAMSSAEIYNMCRKSWCSLPPMPAARDKCVGFIMDNKFYVMGGTDGYHSYFGNAVEYDPSAKAWKTIPNMCLNASYQHSPLVAVHKNQLYAIDDKMTSPSNPSLHAYKKQTNTWQCLGPLLDKCGEGNLYVRNGGLISMGSDKLIVVGEWRSRVKEDEKKTYILAWEASLEATVCEFKIVYSGPAEFDFFDGISLLEFLRGARQEGEEEGLFRQLSEPWLTAVI